MSVFNFLPITPGQYHCSYKLHGRYLSSQARKRQGEITHLDSLLKLSWGGESESCAGEGKAKIKEKAKSEKLNEHEIKINSFFVEKSENAKEEVIDDQKDSLIKSKKKSKKKEKVDESKFCIICMEKNRNAVFEPCNHFCCCGDCAKQIHSNQIECPYCMQPISGYLKVFIP